MVSQFTKGSEWRKWDLHIHTPASFHWNGGKRFRDMSHAEKDVALKQMLQTINDSDVAVFAITDYWTFDGYLEFKSFIQREGLELKKTIFPGMELRIEASTEYRLNMQVILSDKLSMQQLTDFKAKLCLRNINRSISEEAIIQLAQTLDASKARVHGYKAPAELSMPELLELGSKVAEVTKVSLEEAFDSIPKNFGFILMPYDTSDGLEKLDWENHPLEDNYFMKAAHIFETRNQKNVDLFLGKVTEANKKIIKNFQFTLGNKAKPALCGSDAHKFRDYGKFPSDKVTWIKADPTFDGFKQIIYEPESRVRIQLNKPEEKTRYYVIDRVRYNDKSGNKNFSNDWIELNQNLNVIIGGKSSGKSLLLYHIAKSVDSEQVENRTTDKYVFEEDENFDFEVQWLDGEVISLKQQNTKPNYQISYIPQMFIHKISEENGKADLNKIILDLLIQDDTFKKFYDEQLKLVSSALIGIEKSLIQYLDLRTEYARDNEELKKINDKKAIENEIINLIEQIDKYKMDSDLTLEQQNRYTELVAYREHVNANITFYESFNNSLFQLNQDLRNSQNDILYDVKQKISQYSVGLRTDHSEIITIGINKLQSQIMNLIENDVNWNLEKIKENSLVIEELNTKLNLANEEIGPLLEKYENQNKILELEKRLESEYKALLDYKNREAMLAVKTDRGNEEKNKMEEKYKELQEIYISILNQLMEEKYRSISEDITLDVKLLFNKNDFQEQFFDSIDQRQSLNKIISECFNDDNQLFYTDLNDLSNKIFQIFGALIKGKIKLKANVSIKSILLKLLGNFFSFEYNLIHKNDSITEMSPGKRGLVLLQVFLHLSKAQHPILIDQPEDNLDNRTIFTELNSFIKEKKIDRQIIIVTHNANLVVLTDAEEIIVANQAGQQQINDNNEYRFEYVSGSLECSYDSSREESLSLLKRKGIKEHVCEILEGGKDAFEKREQKYGFLK